MDKSSDELKKENIEQDVQFKLERYKAQLGFYYKAAEKHRDHANELAVILVRSILILNGGALIAMITFLNNLAVKSNIKLNNAATHIVILSIGNFSASVVLVIFGVLCVYADRMLSGPEGSYIEIHQEGFKEGPFVEYISYALNFGLLIAGALCIVTSSYGVFYAIRALKLFL